MKLLHYMKNRQDLILVTLLMLIILVMIIPLPTLLIDALIVLNISLTIMILMVAIYLKRPDDFSVLPAIILIATTFRLAISVSTTRMILSQADAGAIVETFGNFVTQGSVVVGIVIFLIITVVQFIVITKGSERVAEVAARFTLDALPGRQMSIDAELRAGDITSEEAISRRQKLEKENQFFGAMDGAMKFVKGDAIAGLVIIAINLIGGISIGMLGSGLSAGEAGQIYSLLTVGDGLVAQLPALILAICAGTIITRVNTNRENDLGTDITEQLIGNSKSLYVGAALITILGLIPGFPTLMFMFVSAMLVLAGYLLKKRDMAEIEKTKQEIEQLSKGLPTNTDNDELSSNVHNGDVFKIEVGSELHQRVDDRVFLETREDALRGGYQRTGIQLPRFGIQENPNLGPNHLAVYLDEVSVFKAELRAGCHVAICEPDLLEVQGITINPLEANWPLRSAYWIEEGVERQLSELEIEIIPASELVARIGAHFLVIQASRILGYKAVQEIIRDLAKEHDQLATQVSQTLSPVQLLNVLRNLLDEGVPLLPRRILFEALLEGSLTGGSPGQLAEQARFALSRQVCANYADDNRVIAGYVLEPQIEASLIASIHEGQEEDKLVPEPDVADILLKEVAERRHIAEINAKSPVILTQANLRRPLSEYLKQNNLAYHIVAFRELAGEFTFSPIGTIGSSYNAGYQEYGDHAQGYPNAA